MIKIKPSLLAEGICAYSEAGEQAKVAFHKDGKSFLRAVATELGLAKTDYTISNNQGGIAVSGEVTLHADSLYIQLSEFGNGLNVLFRSCAGRKDYTGGPNSFVGMRRLADNEEAQSRFLAKCRDMLKR